MTAARLALATANFIVAALNGAAWYHTRDARDMWACIAWAGSTTFWLWAAVTQGGEHGHTDNHQRP